MHACMHTQVLREPFSFMARWPDAGFLTTSDQLGNTTHDDGLETHRGIHSAFNIGYMVCIHAYMHTCIHAHIQSVHTGIHSAFNIGYMVCM